MKKRISAILFSVKSLISNKPMALLLLLLVVILSVIVIGSMSKILLAETEYNIYKWSELKPKKSVDIKKSGEALIALRDNGYLQKTERLSFFNYNFKMPLKNENKNIALITNIEINYQVFGKESFTQDLVIGKEYFTQEMLDSGVKGVIISQFMADELKLNINDTLIFNNAPANTYEVLGIIPGNAGDWRIRMPYYAPLVGIEYELSETRKFDKQYFYAPTIMMFDLPRLPSGEDHRIANAAGLKFKTKSIINAGYIILLVIGIFFTFAILYVLSYIDKVNAKKYAVMNIVGARPLFLASATYLEIMLAALIGIGIGIGIENAIYEKLSWAPIDKFKWIAYIFEIAIAAVTVFAATTIRIIRRTNHRAIDKKSL